MLRGQGGCPLPPSGQRVGTPWSRLVLEAAEISGPPALSGLKLRGRDIGKPIEKGPRAK